MLKQEEITEDRFRLGPQLKGVYIDCLDFADDLVIFASNNKINKINRTSEIAEKIGMHTSFEKTKYMKNISDGPDWVITKYGRIRRVKHFRYLSEVIHKKGLKEEVINVRIRKSDRAYQLTKNTYNRRTMSIRAKFRHYNTVVKPERLYASETLIMGRNDRSAGCKKGTQDINEDPR